MGILLFRPRDSVAGALYIKGAIEQADEVRAGIGVFCSQRASILRDLGGIELHMCLWAVFFGVRQVRKSCCYCGGMDAPEHAASALVGSGA